MCAPCNYLAAGVKSLRAMAANELRALLTVEREPLNTPAINSPAHQSQPESGWMDGKFIFTISFYKNYFYK